MPKYKMTNKRLRDILDRLGVPHELDGWNRIYKVMDIIEHFTEERPNMTRGQLQDMVDLYTHLANNVELKNKKATLAIPRPQWDKNGVET